MENEKQKSIKSHEALQCAESGPIRAVGYYATVTQLISTLIKKTSMDILLQSCCKVHNKSISFSSPTIKCKMCRKL